MTCRITTVDTEVGRLIAHHRKHRGILQSELAGLIGVCGCQISRYERGHEFVSLGRRQKIAEALGIDPAVFADPSLIEVTPDELDLIEAYRLIGTPSGRQRVMAQIESGRRMASC